MMREFRRYRIRPGMLGQFLTAFQAFAVLVIQRHTKLLAFWISEMGELGCVFHLWEFEDHRNRAPDCAAVRTALQYRDVFMKWALPLVEETHRTIPIPPNSPAGCRL